MVCSASFESIKHVRTKFRKVLTLLLVLAATQRGSEIRNLDNKFMAKAESKYIFSTFFPLTVTKISKQGKRSPDI